MQHSTCPFSSFHSTQAENRITQDTFQSQWDFRIGIGWMYRGGAVFGNSLFENELLIRPSPKFSMGAGLTFSTVLQDEYWQVAFKEYNIAGYYHPLPSSSPWTLSIGGGPSLFFGQSGLLHEVIVRSPPTFTIHPDTYLPSPTSGIFFKASIEGMRQISQRLYAGLKCIVYQNLQDHLLTGLQFRAGYRLS